MPKRPSRPSVLPRSERFQLGKSLRKHAPREALSQAPDAGREAIALLERQDRTRLPDLVPVRYQRMAASPFAFLRGAALVMAHDLADGVATGITVQACGDAHLMNFGAYTTVPGTVLFDINDFDESLPGVCFSADVKRLAASIVVAGRDQGLSDRKASTMARHAVKAYRELMADLAELSPLSTFRQATDILGEAERLDNERLRRRIAKLVGKAGQAPDGDDNFPRLVQRQGNKLRFEDKSGSIWHLTTKADKSYRIDGQAVLASYIATLPPERRLLLSRFHLADLAMKVVGVGSVGTFCLIALFLSADQEPLILQIKEAKPSVLEALAPKMKGHQGQRVVTGQKIMQATSDPFLGWASDEGAKRFFYARHLKNRRLGSVADALEGQDLTDYGMICARTLARAHARSGDAAIMAGYMGKGEVFDEAIAAFGLAYAGITSNDHAALLARQVHGHDT